MSSIKDASAEIDDWKINIHEAVVLHIFNNLNSNFWLYLLIVSHDAWEKKRLPTFRELIKILVNKKMHVSNEIKGTANFASRSKSKSKSSNQKNKKATEKRFQPNSNKKKQKNKECRACEGKHKVDCWHLKTECFVCHNVGHIASKWSEKLINTSAFFIATAS